MANGTKIGECRSDCYFFEFGKISHQVTCRYYGVKGECPCRTCGYFVSVREIEMQARRIAEDRGKDVIA